MSDRITKPKTQKGRKILEEKEPKIIENTKSVMLIKGGRTSQLVAEALKNIYLFKKPDAVMFKRKNIMRPFDDQNSLEFFSQKNDASLFVFGCHSKKRPNNLIFGRFYDGQLLDMAEFEIAKFVSMFDIKNEKCPLGTKPCLLFSGEMFDTSAEYKRLKNYFIDFWRGSVVEKIRLQGLEHVIQFTATDGMIYIRNYRVSLKKSGTKVPRVEITEIGPSFDLKLRRTRLAPDDLYKQACRQPKAAKVRKTKNIDHDVFGTRTGRIHMQSQDLDKLQTRKLKALKRTSGSDKDGGKSKKIKRVET